MIGSRENQEFFRGCKINYDMKPDQSSISKWGKPNKPSQLRQKKLAKLNKLIETLWTSWRYKFTAAHNAI